MRYVVVVGSRHGRGGGGGGRWGGTKIGVLVCHGILLIVVIVVGMRGFEKADITGRICMGMKRYLSGWDLCFMKEIREAQPCGSGIPILDGAVKGTKRL